MDTAEHWEALADGKKSWDYKTPTGDVAASLNSYSPPDGVRIAEIKHGTAFYGGAEWQPGSDTGTELDLTAIFLLTDGRWLTLEAWNDYTGWGCQDNAEWLVFDTYEDAIENGLSQEARNHLGLA